MLGYSVSPAKVLGYQSGLVGINRGCDADDNDYYGDCGDDGDDDADLFHGQTVLTPRRCWGQTRPIRCRDTSKFMSEAAPSAINV